MESLKAPGKCIIMGVEIKSVGSCSEARGGKVDGVSTNIGFVSRAGLDSYRKTIDEVAGQIDIIERKRPGAIGKIRKEAKRRLDKVIPQPSTDTPS